MAKRRGPAARKRPRRYLMPRVDSVSHLPEDQFSVPAEHAAEPLAAGWRERVAVGSQRAGEAQGL
eukprot:15203363-Alexandrium_andersonii.AAC.1